MLRNLILIFGIILFLLGCGGARQVLYPKQDDNIYATTLLKNMPKSQNVYIQTNFAFSVLGKIKIKPQADLIQNYHKQKFYEHNKALEGFLNTAKELNLKVKEYDSSIAKYFIQKVPNINLYEKYYNPVNIRGEMASVAGAMITTRNDIDKVYIAFDGNNIRAVDVVTHLIGMNHKITSDKVYNIIHFGANFTNIIQENLTNAGVISKD